MTYRFQEILRLVVPGLYVLFLCFCLVVNTSLIELTTTSTLYKMLTSTFSNAIAIMLPFLGFVVGYIINTIGSLCERASYKREWIKRPSAVILDGNSKYQVESLGNIKKELKIDEVTNATANKAFQKAKEVIYTSGNESIGIFYAQSILARNLACGQILITIFSAVAMLKNCDKAFLWVVASIVLSSILLYNWRRQTCVYAKYVFADYGKSVATEEESGT